ncbi:MAG: alpha/beta fold hydrolase [Acidobacteria bacterium]|nr:alpha/beta fold hydrolase [Acidobacteriota bacterium]
MTVEIDGLLIRYKRAGSGEQVLLLHGWGGSAESFEPVFLALQPHFDTVAIDFPGHGQSSLPPRPWRVSDFLDLTLKLMDRLSLARPHVVAHSFGGRVAIQMAAGHPDRIGKILFTASAGVAPHRSLKRSLKRGAAAVARGLAGVPVAGAVVRALKERMRPHLASRDYLNAGELRETLSLVVSEDLTPLLASVRSRCLLVWGDQDQETPLYMGQTMKAHIPDAELVVFPGAGHFPYLDQQNKFNMLASRFLRE